MKNAWERLENETDAAFSAFKTYLEMDDRSLQKVSKSLQKDPTLIRRWSSKYDWKKRAIAWDNSLLEEVRQKAKQNLGKTISRQLKILDMIQGRTAIEMKDKDLSKTSLKVLSEAFHAALQTQWELYEKIGVTAENTETKDALQVDLNLNFSNLTDGELNEFGKLLEKLHRNISDSNTVQS